MCAHCKLDSNVFSFVEVVIDDNLFEFEELDAFIEAIQSAETLVTWKSSDWCRLFSIKLGPIVDLWNCIAAESGFVPTPQQWEDSKGLSMAQIINMLWKTNNSSGMLKYVHRTPLEFHGKVFVYGEAIFTQTINLFLKNLQHG